MRRFGRLAGSCAFVLALVDIGADNAQACGGCFHETTAPATESTVVTAHRMAVSLSTTQTVLWDQVQYAGNPSEFAWVLPVKPGAVLELSNDAWFETLDATTTTKVVQPVCQSNSSGSFPSGGYDGSYYEPANQGCSLGCAAGEANGGGVGGSGSGTSATSGTGTGGGFRPQPPPVTVVHQGTVGPYETVTLHSSTPGALTNWLVSHNYAIDPSIQMVVDSYEQDGFDFIALRLQPNQGVQAMQPVRVVSPGGAPTLPLRMVAAGTGANVAITLFVIGEGRWSPVNFPSMTLDSTAVNWNNSGTDSNYSTLRANDLALNDGREWLTTFSVDGALLSPVITSVITGPVQYQVGTQTDSTIAAAYVDQAAQNGSLTTRACENAFVQFETSSDRVVDCQGAGGSGSTSASTSTAGGTGGTGGAGGASGSQSASASASTGNGSGGAGGAGGAPPECAPGEIDAKLFACDDLDDVAVALTGMHPRDVWVTRLEANLPKNALDQDLELQAALPQTQVSNWIAANQDPAFPCPGAFGGAGFPTHPTGTDIEERRRRRDFAIFTAVFAAVLAAATRRANRRQTRTAGLSRIERV